MGADLNPGRSFVADAEGESGFSTDRNNLFLTPTAFEKYFQAAEDALAALARGDIKPINLKAESEKMRMTEMSAKPEKLKSEATGSLAST